MSTISVIPANAGIQQSKIRKFKHLRLLDARLHGHDVEAYFEDTTIRSRNREAEFSSLLK